MSLRAGLWSLLASLINPLSFHQRWNPMCKYCGQQYALSHQLLIMGAVTVSKTFSSKSISIWLVAQEDLRGNV